MIERLHLSPRHCEEIEALLHKHLPDVEVWAYGSRVNGRSHDGSDLDLVLRGPKLAEIDTSRIVDFIEALQDSTIPFLVEARDWTRLPESFHREIEREHVVLVTAVQEGEPKEIERAFTIIHGEMREEWAYVQLGEVVDLLAGFPFKSAGYVNHPKAPHLLRGDNIGQGTLRWDGAKRWPQEATDKLTPYWLCRGDVVVAMDRPWIEAGLKYSSVRETDLPALLVQRVARLRGSDRLDTRFLNYVIGCRDFTEYVRSVQTGTAVPHISARQIREFEFALPPLPEQRAIAHILGTLDDKIELNRRMNETLEAMARALFKSWFVDFDPVRAKMEGRDIGLPKDIAALFPDRLVDSELGEIPEGWEVKTLAETVEIIGGGTPKTSVPHYWDGDIPWFSVVDAPAQSDIWVVDTAKKATQIGIENSSAQMLPVGTTIISARGTVGRIALVGVPMAMNQSCYGLRRNGQEHGSFNYFTIRALVVMLQQRTHGSVFDTITRDTLAAVYVVSPCPDVIDAYERLVRPALERIRAGLFQSRHLVALRDPLLPKLIGGELRVEGVNGHC